MTDDEGDLVTVIDDGDGGFGTDAGVVRKALVGAIVMSTTVQVASNILQTVSTSGSTSTGERSGLNRGMLVSALVFYTQTSIILVECTSWF